MSPLETQIIIPYLVGFFAGVVFVLVASALLFIWIIMHDRPNPYDDIDTNPL